MIGGQRDDSRNNKPEKEIDKREGPIAPVPKGNPLGVRYLKACQLAGDRNEVPDLVLGSGSISCIK